MEPPRPQPGECPEGMAAYLAAAAEGPVMELLRAQGDEVRDLFGALTEAQGDFRYAPGKWSLKDLLQHLSDAERIFAYRCLRIGRGDATPLPGFEEDDYAAAARAGERNLASLLAEFLAVRAASLALFAGLDAQAWAQVGTASGKSVTARCFPFVCLGHAAHHLTVIRARYLSALR